MWSRRQKQKQAERKANALRLVNQANQSYDELRDRNFRHLSSTPLYNQPVFLVVRVSTRKQSEGKYG